MANKKENVFGVPINSKTYSILGEKIFGEGNYLVHSQNTFWMNDTSNRMFMFLFTMSKPVWQHLVM